MAVAAGQLAPDFTLKDQHGSEVTLSSLYADKHVVLVFYPFTFSGICEGELCALRDDIADFERDGVQVVALSCDSRFSQAAWATQQGYTFPVLADNWPHGAVAAAYGVFNEDLGCANRATFVINRGGQVAETFASPNLGTPRDKAAYEGALARLT
jgi:peroxiredoxin